MPARLLEPVIFPPLSGVHRHTLVLLHGTHSTGKKFSDALFAPLPRGKVVRINGVNMLESLRTLLPDWRFVFPSGRPRHVALIGGQTNAWFDMHSWEDRTEMEHLNLAGMIESTRDLSNLLVREAILFDQAAEVIRRHGGRREAPEGKVWLGGFSQGCAMSMMFMLSGEFENQLVRKFLIDPRISISRFGGMVGMSGWLPFRQMLLRFLDETWNPADGLESIDDDLLDKLISNDEGKAAEGNPADGSGSPGETLIDVLPDHGEEKNAADGSASLEETSIDVIPDHGEEGSPADGSDSPKETLIDVLPDHGEEGYPANESDSPEEMLIDVLPDRGEEANDDESFAMNASKEQRARLKVRRLLGLPRLDEYQQRTRKMLKIWLAHGQKDVKVKAAWGKEMCKFLKREMEWDVQGGYYSGLAHAWCERELRDIAAYLTEQTEIV